MNNLSYLALNAWLQTADRNYISGRLLWLNSLVVGASNLLWLSCEQLIKIVLLQSNIEEISKNIGSLDELHKKLDTCGKNLGHKVKTLFLKVSRSYPDQDLSRFAPALIKIHEYFYRRYYVRSSSSISLDLLKSIDEFYFSLRGLVLPDVGLGIIDEIYLQRKHNKRHPVKSFSAAYDRNNFFAPRKHFAIWIIGKNGKSIKEIGE